MLFNIDIYRYVGRGCYKEKQYFIDITVLVFVSLPVQKYVYYIYEMTFLLSDGYKYK